MKSNSNWIYQTLLSGIIICMLAACGRESIDLGGDTPAGAGTLSFTSFSVNVSSETEVISKASGDTPFWVAIFNSQSEKVQEWSHDQIPASITLATGSYSLRVQTIKESPTIGFETPVYGTTQLFTIKAGEQTSLGSLTCRLLQVKVSIGYSESIKKLMGEDCKAVVSIDNTTQNSLEFLKGEERAGYLLPSATSMIVKFTGTIAGSYQTITKAVTDIKAAQWRKITFEIVINNQGKAAFNTIVDDQVISSDLLANVDVNEPVIGEDPEGGNPDATAPKVTYLGDAVPTTPITVTSGMNLAFQISAVNGIKDFKVDMASTNSDFVDDILSTGVSPLDLINPTDAQRAICQLFGLPFGNDVSEKNDILFNLTDATMPLCGFAGVHTFTLTITDKENKQTVCPIIMKVK